MQNKIIAANDTLYHPKPIKPESIYNCISIQVPEGYAPPTSFRPPKKGEWFICSWTHRVEKARINFDDRQPRFILEELPEYDFVYDGRGYHAPEPGQYVIAFRDIRDTHPQDVLEKVESEKHYGARICFNRVPRRRE